jgi:competence protein ComEC
MALFTLFFTLGVWLLQQQAALPDFVWAWLLIGLPFTLLIPAKSRLLRALLIAVFACGIGLYHAAWLGEQRLSISLPDVWQGQKIDVIGVVAELPHRSERGLRFSFNVEKTLTPEVSVTKHIYLSTYFDPGSKPLNLHAGERWQLTLRLKQPHGSSNPHGFDFELWALENNVRAVGYVHSKSNNIRLDAMADGVSYRIESWREAARDKFNATLSNAPYVGVLSALAVS